MEYHCKRQCSRRDQPSGKAPSQFLGTGASKGECPTPCLGSKNLYCVQYKGERPINFVAVMEAEDRHHTLIDVEKKA